ncbi:MAG: hypothetical protein ACKO2G_16915 [Verrucomicrobiales bacterium]
MEKKYITLKHGARPAGFALVATLSIIALLVILVMGLLGLSQTSSRRSQQDKARARAQANARLSMALAIGALQKHAGSDTRITAPADILSPDNPPLVGVWRSWEGSNHQSSGILTGRPTKPDYTAKQKNTTENGRFLTWLVSAATPVSSLGGAVNLVAKAPATGTIPLLSSGSLAPGDKRQVHVVPFTVNGSGSFAWWASGENQKAHLPEPSQPKTDMASAWSDHARSHAVGDPAVFGLESLLTDPSPARKSPNRNTVDLFADKAAAALPSQSFHDLSVDSIGLLTNVATGGWRKDFSLLTEKWDEQPATGLEFFKLSPTQHLPYTRPANDTDYRPANCMLYHWADFRVRPGYREFWEERGPIASWAKIKTYATLYKSMSNTTSNAPNINHRSWEDRGWSSPARTDPAVRAIGHEIFHNVRLVPQTARIQFIVSHYAIPGGTPGKFRPAVLYTPVVTIWNPYNTRLTLTNTLICDPAFTLPLALRHQLSGGPVIASEYWSVQGQSTLGFSGPPYNNKCLGANMPNYSYRLTINQVPLILEPGETRIFSPTSTTPLNHTLLNHNGTNNHPTIALTPGVRTGGGIYYTLDRKFNPGVSPTPIVEMPGSVGISADAKFDVPTLTNTSTGLPACGTTYQWGIGALSSGRSHSWYQIAYNQSEADTLYPPKTGLASTTLAECAVRPVPFLSAILGSRIANHRATSTKGLVQADPVVDFFSPSVQLRWTDIYPGNDNLINSPWDFSIVEHASAGDDMLPNVDNTTNSSYIVTGVRKADGVSRMVSAELPTRPLVSLADLTHMQIRGINPTPPYSGNIVANSDASPLISKDNVVNTASGRAGRRDNEQQDDSYCANHVLFDDWFFSSIAPKPMDFGPSGGTDLRQTYLDLLTAKESLINRAYQPILEDRVANDTEAAAKFTTNVHPITSWRTIASRLEVEGMFNVNSTSVRAWRALLGHARNQKIPYSQSNGAIGLSAATDHAFTRTSIAGDRAAGQPPQTPGEYADTTEFTGHRVFTDEMLDKLAENIVAQVRARGPFLSLSEFVNRQLSTDKNLALAGAIQTALNQLTADSSLNPFETIQNESVPSLGDPPGADGYVFREAAVGHNTYGLPGWTRQADILRPLAPILSARDDTFTIRAYGESMDAAGKVLARAWCEVTLQRTRDFLDPKDAPEITTQPTVPANQSFGRRFKVVSFRWLNGDEV